MPAKRGQAARRSDCQATEEIGEIRSATDPAMDSISRTARTIDTIQHSSEAIAGAVEEQGAVTAEIASNTQCAATNMTDVTQNISGVGTTRENSKDTGFVKSLNAA